MAVSICFVGNLGLKLVAHAFRNTQTTHSTDFEDGRKGIEDGIADSQGRSGASMANEERGRR